MDSLNALTHSTTWALLRLLWRGHDAHAESGRGHYQLHPRPAAFLDGVRLIVEGRWRATPEAFARAFTLDSTFRLAY